jgi:3-hydroxyacyl-[acyl-carrier-protein] dehydratase
MLSTVSLCEQPGACDFAAPLHAVDSVSCAADGGGWVLETTTRIDARDPHLQAHFPGFTIFPGVFILESLRQGVAFACAGHDPVRVSEIRSIQFLTPLFPGDVLTLNATLKLTSSGTIFADAWARRGTKAAARLKVEFVREVAEGATGRSRSAILPHAHPMLLVDRIVSMKPGESAVGIKAITLTEPCYAMVAADAPPELRAYPASLLIESFGQVAAMLWLASTGRKGLASDDVVVLAGIRNCRIESSAFPGDVVRHEVRLAKCLTDAIVIDGRMWVDRRRIAVVESMLAAVRPRAAVKERSGSSLGL